MPERDFKTSDSKEYYFNEVPTNSSCTLRFRVKTSNDAHICLSASGVLETTPILEIFLGGWENKMSAIRKDYTLPDKVKVSTPDLLSSKEYHKFWIKWNNKGQVDVGRDGNEEPFMSYLDPNPFPISHYGMRTTWGATGKWKDHEVEYVIHEGQAPPAAGPPVATEPETLQHLPYHWVSARNGEIPQGAVVAGKDHGEQVLAPGSDATDKSCTLPSMRFCAGDHRRARGSLRLVGKSPTMLLLAEKVATGRSTMLAAATATGPSQLEWVCPAIVTATLPMEGGKWFLTILRY
ncbi:uncharacterized protein LOC132194240 isoform X2 [Neocloeon triangulifer]|uniref:uncharacterized protein LOC132194240 isoform X2 n=1 Tax=Neocloeon triangulifer TaxID=2078957 RepID=UPI00286FA02C|nr:uncharacterized protein LOC132194240 isoform X2 [Neocloeon triangulifer]